MPIRLAKATAEGGGKAEERQEPEGQHAAPLPPLNRATAPEIARLLYEADPRASQVPFELLPPEVRAGYERAGERIVDAIQLYLLRLELTGGE